MPETLPPSPVARVISSSPAVSILLVDDQPANLLALEALLDDLGHKLVRASSGEEALRLSRDADFAVILLDVQMAGLDGFETARRIRSHEARHHTPIIFLTAYETEPSQLEQAYELGAVDYLVKPLIPVILRAKVAGFVELFQKSEQIKRQAEQLRQVERREFQAKLAEENRRLRQSEERLRFLSEASKLLASSLDYESTLQAVAQLAVPALADWCTVDVLWEEDQSIRRVAVVHRDPAKVALGHELLRRYPLRLDMPEGTVLRSGQSILAAEIADDMLVAYARDAEHLAILRQLDLKSTLVVPLAARGRILGAMSLVSDQSSGRRYGPEDLALAEELGRRAGLAVDNARLYRSAQDALRQKEESLALLDTLQNNAPVGFAFVDREFRFVRINEAMAAINGRPLADHMGHTVQEVIPQLWPTVEPLYRRVLDGGEPVDNLELSGETAAAPGQRRHWLVSYYPVRIGPEIAGIGVLVSEITERKRAEEALRESEQRFARFMQHLPGLAWIKDRHGRYVYVNDAAEKAFARPRAQLYGRTDDDVFPPETARRFHDNDRRALASEAGVQVIEELEHKDGIVHRSVVSKFPIVGADGETLLIGGMAIDITERLQMEEALKEADRRKDEFLAMLAHELRNPLAPIRNAVQILRLVGPAAPSVQQARDMIDRQVVHLVRLVDDLLDVSRITRGKIALQKKAVDVATVIASAVESSRPLIDARGHNLTLSLSAEPLPVLADPTRLSQVIMNLLNNSAKYTPEGGHIALGTQAEDGQAVIRVKDDGVGIAPDLLPKVFDLFIQAERSLDRSQGGLGIGLTLVRSLVQMHGGTVEAHSAGLGKGSEFVVRLPLLVGKTTSDASAPGGADAIPAVARRLLVVDDNKDAADSLAALLRILGHDVRTVYDGPTAVKAALEYRPDMLFLDIGLPGMDGHEVARRLRREPGFGDTVFVALTGYGGDGDRRRSEETGFLAHLVKPVEFAVLQQLLAALWPLAKR
jgi:PAS domain S-box-containing protein